jgi:alpha-beta hydrolase superfamily lysophospholipase
MLSRSDERPINYRDKTSCRKAAFLVEKTGETPAERRLFDLTGYQPLRRHYYATFSDCKPVNNESTGKKLRNCLDYPKIEELKKEGRPTSIMGHSMGSFMVQRYLQLYPDTVDRVILCGTNGGNASQMKMAYTLAKLTCNKKNWDEPDKFLTNAGLGGYAKAVKNRKTDLDWLSFNEDNVAKYIADPYCGHMDTHGFWKEFLKGMVALNSKKEIKKISPKEKVLIISGQYDPVGGNGKGPTYMANLYQKLGMKDVTLVIYPNMRHEIHNEKEHMKVYEQISEFLNK